MMRTIRTAPRKPRENIFYLPSFIVNRNNYIFKFGDIFFRALRQEQIATSIGFCDSAQKCHFCSIFDLWLGIPR